MNFEDKMSNYVRTFAI